MVDRWPYSCYSVGCYLQDLFNKAHSFLMQWLSGFFPIRLVSLYVEHPYSSIDTTADWKKKLPFILSCRSELQFIDSLSIAVHAFASCVLVFFQLMKRWFLGWWTCLPVSEDHYLVCRFHPALIVLFCLRLHGGLCYLLLVPDYVARVRLLPVYLSEALCHRRSPRPK